MKGTPVKPLLSLLLAAACVASPLARADDGDDVRPPREVHGVRLGSICGGCGVVSDTRTEVRTGDGTGVGAIGGALVGGVVGHQLGGGSGRAALSVLGALGGGFAGNAIEKNAKKSTLWVTEVTFRDGSTDSYEAADDPRLDEGDIVRIEHGHPVRQGR
jgi:outer membrane lipoprotein SlyB